MELRTIPTSACHCFFDEKVVPMTYRWLAIRLEYPWRSPISHMTDNPNHCLPGQFSSYFFSSLTVVGIDESMDERSAIFDSLCKYKDFNVSYFHLNFAFDRLMSSEESSAPQLNDEKHQDGCVGLDRRIMEEKSAQNARFFAFFVKAESFR
uniref:Uncharacterized protein n=1 Tax=Romanomermis culicivorax TaxID=13658 RepID=A0A915I011_ROMCU